MTGIIFNLLADAVSDVHGADVRDDLVGGTDFAKGQLAAEFVV